MTDSRELTIVVDDSLPAPPMTAMDYAAKAKASSTARAYKSAMKTFATYCARSAQSSMPASADTVADYLAWRANNGIKVNTIGVDLAAIVAAHKLGGFDLDASTGIIAATWSGIRTTKASEPDQAEPLSRRDLVEALAEIGTDIRALRDRAILAFGLVAGRRRSELSGLDLDHVGNGTGYVKISDQGVDIVLLRSKKSGGKIKTFAIPRKDAPTAVSALERWVEAANVQPGTPVFRGIDRHNNVLSGRYSCDGIVRTIKRRMKDIGKDETIFSGHSLRVGFAVEAINNGAAHEHVADHLGHASTDMTRHYAKRANKWAGKATSKVGF